MEIYNQKMERIENPDLTKGRLEHSKITRHHEPIEPVEELSFHRIVKEYPNGGKDVEKVVTRPGVKGRPAYDEEVEIAVYIPFTREELEAFERENNKPTIDQRLKALEEFMEKVRKVVKIHD